MPLVGKIGSTTEVNSGRVSGRAPIPEAAAAPVQRALVRVASATPEIAASIRAAGGRATAPFLAHLIATDQGVPQTRERRRIDPNWATTAYGAMLRVPNLAGQTIRESR